MDGDLLITKMQGCGEQGSGVQRLILLREGRPWRQEDRCVNIRLNAVEQQSSAFIELITFADDQFT